MKPSQLRFRPRFNFLTALLFGLAAGLVCPLAAQTTIGYVPNADLGSANHTGYAMTSSTGYVVAFDFTSSTLGNSSYNLNSVSLLLSGDANLADFSAQISATAPTSLTLPTALTTLSSANSGTLNSSTASAYSFAPGSSYTFSADTTYYLTVLYTGANTANWIATSTAGGVYSGLLAGYGASLDPLTTALDPGYYGIFDRQITTSGYNDPWHNQSGANAGLAITATAVPEPGTTASIFGAVALLAGLFIRRRRLTQKSFRS